MNSSSWSLLWTACPSRRTPRRPLRPRPAHGRLVVAPAGRLGATCRVAARNASPAPVASRTRQAETRLQCRDTARSALLLSRGSTRTTAPAGTEVAATGRSIPRARALRRKAGVRISAVPSSLARALSPRSRRQPPIAPALMLCQGLRARASTPTSLPVRTSCGSVGGRARRPPRVFSSSSDPRASNALTERSQAVALRRSISLDAAAETLGLSAHSRHRVGRRRRYSPVVRCERVVRQRAGYHNARAERHSDGRASRPPSLVMKLQAAAWRAASTAPVSSTSRWAPSI